MLPIPEVPQKRRKEAPMFPKDNIWYLGTQFMACVQARDRRSAHRQLRIILNLISQQSGHHFSLLKLRTLQVLTNANRAAFNSGAAPVALGSHSMRMIGHIDRATSKTQLLLIARIATDKTISLVPSSSAYRERIMQEAIAYIRAHFAEHITREQLASILKCSPTHFSRLFSRTTGYTYKDYLLQCRLQKAKELLRRSHLQVAEIAEAVGYIDPFQFSKIFRKRVGVSPRQYRDTRLGSRNRERV